MDGMLPASLWAIGSFHASADSGMLASRLASAHDALLRGDGPNAVRHALNGLSIAPDSPDAAFLLGLAWDPRWFARSLALAPDHLGAALNRAQALIASGRRPLAARVIRRFAAMVPAEVPALVNLALLSEPPTARMWLARAAALGPDDPLVRVNLAAILDRLGLSGPAAREHRRAVVLAPTLALATVNLALACFTTGEMNRAGSWHRRTLALDPHAADAMTGLGAIARDADHPAEGRGWDRRSLALRPDHVPTLANLSAAAVAIGEAKEGRFLALRAEAIDPAPPGYGSVAVAHYLPGWSAEEIFALHRRWVGRLAPVEHAKPPRRPVSGRLKVGVLSGDLFNHPVGWNVLGLFEHHREIELHVYAESPRRDAVTARFQARSASWTTTRGLSDAEVAERMRRSHIDLLLVLAGQTAGNRLLVVAHGAAPVQASVHDIATSGLRSMDWWLTDGVLHPEGTAERFTERLWRLPCFYLHQPPEVSPPVGPRPGEQRPATFVSFNHPAKMTPEVVRVWSRVLKAVPGSRLLLKYAGVFGEEAVRSRYARLFEAQDVERERLDFRTVRLDRERHLDLLNEVDVALDPFPFNGATTSFEALWMGVPVVSLAGDRFLGRVGASMLAALGRPELIAADEDAYVALAATLAEDRRRLSEMRRSLRDELLRSPLLDAPAHARAFESALLAMSS